MTLVIVLVGLAVFIVISIAVLRLTGAMPTRRATLEPPLNLPRRTQTTPTPRATVVSLPLSLECSPVPCKTVESLPYRKVESLPYRKKDYLFSRAERSFYGVLRLVVSDQWIIFAKVRLVDLVWLPRNTANIQSHRNRVQSKHVDFLLCDPRTLGPVLAIELDDASHQRYDRLQRDEFVDEALRAAGLPLLRVTAKGGYVTADLARRIREATGQTPTPTDAARQIPS